VQAVKLSSDQPGVLQGGRSVTLFIDPDYYLLSGEWKWDGDAHSILCSNVMYASHPQHEGPKGLIHPEDLVSLRQFVQNNHDSISFRIITSYGEVRELQGSGVSTERLVPGNTLPSDTLLQNEMLLHGLKRSNQEALMLDGIHNWALGYSKSGTWWHNLKNNETWYSPEIYAIHDLPPFSLNAHLDSFSRFIHPEDRQLVEGFIDRSFRETVPLHIEFRIVTPYREKTVFYATNWIANSNGESILAGLMQDITEQKQRELKYEEEENMFQLTRQQLTFNEQQLTIGNWQLNLVTRSARFSDQVYQIFGLKSKTTLSSLLALSEAVHPEDQHSFRQVQKNLITTGDLSEYEFRISRTDGRVRYIVQKGKLVEINGEPTVIGVFQDITIRRNLDKKIQTLTVKQSLETVIQQHAEEMSGIARWIWNLRTDEVSWSDNLVKKLGLRQSPFSITKKQLLSYIYPDDRGLFETKLDTIISSGEELEFDFRFASPGQVLYMKARFRKIESNGDTLIIALFQDLSSEYLLRKELDQRIELAEALSQNILDCVIITSTEHIVLAWNQKCVEKYGIDRSAALGKNFFELLPRTKTAEKLELLQRVLNGEKIFQNELRSRHGDGFYNLHLLPLWDDARSEVRGVVHVIHDISAEVNLRNKLKERLHFIESLVENTVDRVIALDSEMNYLVWNKKCEEYFGLTKQQVLGRNILDIFPEHRFAPGYEQFKSALRGDTIYLPPVESAAETEYYETYLSPIRNGAGDVTAVLWISHDLSTEYQFKKEQDQYRRELENKHRRFVVAQQVGQVGIFEWTRENNQFYWSEEMFRIHGLEPFSCEVDLDLVTRFFPDEERERLWPEILKLRSEAGSVDLVHRIVRADGAIRYVNKRLMSFADSEGGIAYLSGTVHDITEQVEAALGLKASRDLLLKVLDESRNAVFLLRYNEPNSGGTSYELLLSNAAARLLTGDDTEKALTSLEGWVAEFKDNGETFKQLSAMELLGQKGDLYLSRLGQNEILVSFTKL